MEKNYNKKISFTKVRLSEKMCNSLEGQVFYLNKMNTYQRYSDLDNRIVTYHTKGLVVGENLPPISNHFHWCRSDITYLVDLTYQKMYNITNQDAFVGTEGNVKPNEIDLTDAIVTHNHPKNQTRFSLSSLDMNMFNEEKISRLRGFDYKYTYEFNRDSNFKMPMPTIEELEQIENKDEAFHLDNIKNSYQYDFGYKRWEND